jgi:hypothetical protein
MCTAVENGSRNNESKEAFNAMAFDVQREKLLTYLFSAHKNTLFN